MNGPGRNRRNPGREWDPVEVEQVLEAERSYHAQCDEDGNEIPSTRPSYPEMSRRKLRDNCALAVESIVWLSRFSDDERLRFKASKYIVDRVMGKTDKKAMSGSGGDLLQELVSGVVEVNGN